MKNPDLSKQHLLPDEVNVNLNVLGTTMLDRIRGHVHNTYVVTEDKSGSRQRVMKVCFIVIVLVSYYNNYRQKVCFNN